MTTTRERREEYHTNVVRTLTPSRPLSPGTHTIEFDSNLDNLLEDLQASVSRPGSSLGQPIAGSYSSSREVQYLQPANVTTVARERSLSPNLQTGERKVYKTAKYEYKSSGSSGSGPVAGTQGVSEVYQRNINQLDTLLNDLERERDSSLDRSQRSLHRNGIDSGLIEPGTKIVKTTTTYSSAGGKQPVSRELVFDSPGSYEVRQSRSRQRSPSYENSSTVVKNVSYSSDNSGIYGGINRSRTVTPVRSEQYYTETRTVSPNSDVVPPNVQYNETVLVDTAPAAKALANIPISGDILPRPNTKVTTTVRTYTYEIPPESDLNQTLSYRNESFNQSSNTVPATYPGRDLSPTQHVNPSSRTVIVKNESINTTNNVQEYPIPTIVNHQLPPNTAKTIYYKKDTKQSNTHYYPEHPNGPHPTNFKAIEGPPASDHHPPPHPIKYTNDPSYPPPPPSTNTYIYREERTTNNTTNRYGSPVPIVEYPDRHGTYPREPQPPPTVTYKYSSTTTNATRNMYPPPEEREPLLQPFPTDGIPQSEVDGNPPKRVEDLMATLGENGQVTYMSKHTHHTSENGTGPKKPRGPSPPKKAPIDEPVDSKAALVSSKNIAGPPVYYPPGHEMFAKKESEGGAWRAQGEYARASGKYMYEAESKSKTTSKSGAAVVPVCLPLCCAMPCSIM
ncbi:adhesive plaque matrix protein [Toxorhynchites rutilus septentrionalis]|uniref:adhesive plaque matrix protein n=1 Tax=Toxorhynchites rutilus septentrionalis TaxID=329112 RepID=UPI00247A198D|nr:adhesive plaque matrix protein [Toxorhynchites rutilus septentrionalis]